MANVIRKFKGKGKDGELLDLSVTEWMKITGITRATYVHHLYRVGRTIDETHDYLKEKKDRNKISFWLRGKYYKDMDVYEAAKYLDIQHDHLYNGLKENNLQESIDHFTGRDNKQPNYIQLFNLGMLA